MGQCRKLAKSCPSGEAAAGAKACLYGIWDAAKSEWEAEGVDWRTKMEAKKAAKSAVYQGCKAS